MTSWTARAKAHFSHAPRGGTDKTDTTPLLSVLAVPCQDTPEKPEGVSSVSSVGVVALFENHALARDLIAAAMAVCDAQGDGEQARADMRAEIDATPPHLRQDLLEHLHGDGLRAAQNSRRARGGRS